MYPTDEPETIIIITGVYIPPKRTKDLTLQKLKKLEKGNRDKIKRSEIIPSHIIGGDFNTTSWQELFHEWTQERGIRELTDPGQPTITTGGSIDKFLLIPGDFVPENLFPPEPDEGGERGDIAAEMHYPVYVWQNVTLCSHYSIFLKIPASKRYQTCKKSSNMQVESLTEEQWGEKDEEIGRKLKEQLPLNKWEESNRNPDHLYNKLEKIIKLSKRPLPQV